MTNEELQEMINKATIESFSGEVAKESIKSIDEELLKRIAEDIQNNCKRMFGTLQDTHDTAVDYNRRNYLVLRNTATEGEREAYLKFMNLVSDKVIELLSSEEAEAAATECAQRIVSEAKRISEEILIKRIATRMVISHDYDDDRYLKSTIHQEIMPMIKRFSGDK